MVTGSLVVFPGLFPLNCFGFSPEFLKLRMSAYPAPILFFKFGAWTIFKTCARGSLPFVEGAGIPVYLISFCAKFVNQESSIQYRESRIACPP
jgi:hypothetical protein